MAWCDGRSEGEWRLIVRELAQFCTQGRATEDDAREATAHSSVRPTHTSVVMLMRWQLHMSHLPPCGLPGVSATDPAAGDCRHSPT
ncbi:DUF5958 family protein [Streptomyces hirsutus]|uniref:DUF5958 family protein n=1 Tax=Streptomyces hirsutus TaxID=35620 RepID=UPI0036B66F8D